MRIAVGAVYQTADLLLLQDSVPALGVEVSSSIDARVTPCSSGAMMPYEVPVTQPGSAVHQ